MGTRARSYLLPMQVAAVATLSVGSVIAMWRSGEDAVAPDRRRAEALRTLAKADDALAIAGARGLDVVPSWPDTLEPEDWSTLDDWLAAQVGKSLAGFPHVGGGYFIPSTDRYLGHGGATRTAAKATTRSPRPAIPDRPLRERDLIDDQVGEALDKDRPVDRIVEMSPEAVAVRASPVRVNGRRVAVIWVLARLDDAATLGRSVRSYQWASGMALGGLVLALIIAASLARTIQKHAADRRRLEEEVRRGERLAALGTLLAGVSHEMRNPLAGIRSVAQLWERGIVTDQELSSELIGEVDRLDTIVGHLLMFSRAEPKSLEAGDLNGVVSEAARLCRAIAEGQGVAVAVDLLSDAPPVALDPSSLLQVLRNLTSNAIDSMPTGGRLGLATRFGPDHGSIEVVVNDTGPGLSREVLDHLFEPFYTTKPQGTGLGLAIAREIVLAHRGSIHAHNRRAGGAEFVVALPPWGLNP